MTPRRHDAFPRRERVRPERHRAVTTTVMTNYRTALRDVSRVSTASSMIMGVLRTSRTPLRDVVSEQHRQQLQADEPASCPHLLGPFHQAEYAEIDPSLHRSVYRLAHLADVRPLIGIDNFLLLLVHLHATVPQVRSDQFLLALAAEEPEHEVHVSLAMRIVPVPLPHPGIRVP